MLLSAAFALFITAVIVLAVALRGRRIDDHPICRCGFDLIGLYPGAVTCPECGCGLARAGVGFARRVVRKGNRRRFTKTAVLAGIAVFISAVAAGVLVADARAKGGWNASKPTWWLIFDASGSTPAAVDAALTELLKRQGQGNLQPDQIERAVRSGLKWQADSSRGWLVNWGEFIETAWQDGVLTREQQESYARNALVVSVRARTKVRQGDSVPALVAVQCRAGASGLLAYELELEEMMLGGQDVKDCYFEGDGPVDCGTSAPRVSEMAFSPLWGTHVDEDYVRNDKPVSINPGASQLKTVWRVKVGLKEKAARGPLGGIMSGPSWTTGSGPPAHGIERAHRMTPIVEQRVESVAPVEVVGANVESVTLVTDEALEKAVRDAIQVSIQDRPASSFQGARRAVIIRAGDVGVDLVFDVTVRGAGVEKRTSFVSGQDRGFGSSPITVPRGEAGTTYEVILTPSPELARRTLALDRIWGREIVFNDVKPTRSEHFESVSRSAKASGVRMLATLKLPASQRLAPNNQAFRSVALKMPYVYVGDREGSLFIFRVEETDEGYEKEAEKVIDTFGDGNDLKVVGDFLLTTRRGRLGIYSLKSPTEPMYLGTFGPDDDVWTDSIVIGGSRAFLLGQQGIRCFDISDPEHPALVSVTKTEHSPWTGCIVGHHLIAGESWNDWTTHGIGVYDISDPGAIVRVGLIETSETVYAVHPLSEDRVIAMLDASERSYSGFGPRGDSIIVDISDVSQPKVAATNVGTSGRVSTLVEIGSDRYLVCPGAVMKLEGTGLRSIFPLRGPGSNLDGTVYHGCSDGVHAALAMDDTVLVIKIGPFEAGPR